MSNTVFRADDSVAATFADPTVGGRQIEYTSGAAVFEQGSEATHVYFIQRGQFAASSPCAASRTAARSACTRKARTAPAGCSRSSAPASGSAPPPSPSRAGSTPRRS